MVNPYRPWLVRVELHATPKLDIFAYYGGDIRLIQEGNLGFWHKFYQGPKGGLRWGLTYSYITKTGWSGAASNSPKAVDNMVFTPFRYYLP